MATRQTPQPLIPGYKKLSDFIQPQKRPLPETQEISVIPRMNLPTRNMATEKIVEPWVTAWSSKKAETSSIATSKGIEQAPICTPLPEILSDIETMHLPTQQCPEATSQTGKRINTCVSTKNGNYSDPLRRLQRHPFFAWLCALLPVATKRTATQKKLARHRRC